MRSVNSLYLFAGVVTVAFWAAAAPPAPVALKTLKAGERAHRFEVVSIYLDAADRPLGARFLHQPTGFQLDLLQIESVPQAFTWVKSFATSDQGEPHTQEHLLLLRGKSGRTLATRQSMSLVTHSAYTETWRTSYMFNTTAGVDTFFDVFAQQQSAMLRPDYSDAEIRLEVRNFGVTQGGDGQLRLQEKGTVYNEMVASMANGPWKAWRAQNHAVYGTQHALSYNQGGEPAGIRTMTPEDIRRFHSSTHHLANMGTVAAFPRSVAIDNLLQRFDRVLMLDAPPAGTAPRRPDTLAQLPPPAGDPEGSLRLYEYPQFNEQQPSPVTLVWPATRRFDAGEQLLAELFFDNVAGDATTELYALFIDGRSRKLDTGARAIAAEVSAWGGHPVAIYFSDVRPAAMTDTGLRALRQIVVDELARIAGWPDGSAELKAFNERMASRVLERERQALRFIGTPPGFGARGGSSAWVDLLMQLEQSPGTRKSLVMKPEFARVRSLLQSERNVWRELLAQWHITGTQPYITGARPSPALIAREQAEREARLQEETARIQQRYAETDTQKALARFQADSNTELAQIEKASKVPPMPFVRSPPMTLDDGLQFETLRLAHDVPLVASRFDSMTGAMIGLALRADGVPRDDLRYLSLLPELLVGVGVIDKDQPVSFEQMSERLRREILSLNASFSTNVRTGRVELVLRSSGVGPDESRRALDWMSLVLHTPDWRAANLPRIRDLVDQQLAALRNTLQRPEEAWVNDPAHAWRMQRNPAWLAAASFMTRTHNALRLRWLLKEASPEDALPVAAFMTQLAQAGRGLDRDRLKEVLVVGKAPGWEALSPAQRALMTEALRDLDLSLADMPDASLGADFSALTLALRDDLATPAAVVLQRLDAVRQQLVRAGGARLFLASPPELRTDLLPRLQAFTQRLDPRPFVPQAPADEGLISARLRSRGAEPAPVHVGLLAPNKQGGVILSSVPSVHFADVTNVEKQLDFLASRLYGGGGSHSAFSRTIGAGLAYSNGLRGTVSQASVGYYAERTPELPQTVRFVVDLVKSGKPDPALGEYVMAQAFSETRASQSYEARAEGIAADLADGQPPQMVRQFRQALLELRRNPKLVDLLFERKDRVHARLLPGYDRQGLDTEAGSFIVIGPERQLAAWEQYLQARALPAGRPQPLQRLHGRDFWMP